MTKINTQKSKRTTRIRKNIKGVSDRPRLSIYRSNAFIYAQIIDDAKGTTLIGVSEKNLCKATGNKTEKAKALGVAMAKEALSKKIKAVVFDKGSYKFHGRVKAFAEGAREGGLDF